MPTSRTCSGRSTSTGAWAWREPSQQAVLFCCWSPDVEAFHAELRDAGIVVGAIEYPFYMPAGEFRVVDPDGYVLLVGQLNAAGS